MPAYADTYATTTNDGPVILTIDGINEEDCEIDYTMDMDHSLDEEAINVVADVRNNNSIRNDTTMDNLMAVDVQTVRSSCYFIALFLTKSRILGYSHPVCLFWIPTYSYQS